MDPPPYSEHSSDASQLDPRRLSHDDAEEDSSLPAYESLDNTNNPNSKVASDKKVANSSLPSSSSSPSTTLRPPGPLEAGPSSQASPSSSSLPSSSAAKSRSPLSLVRDATQAYSDKKKAKQAARKVDFYEKIYGFVPKNAMSEAEWKRARENAPKVKVKGKLRATPYGMFT